MAKRASSGKPFVSLLFRRRRRRKGRETKWHSGASCSPSKHWLLPDKETLTLSQDPGVLVTPVNEFDRLEAAIAITPKLPHPSAAKGGGGVGQLAERGARLRFSP